MQKNPMVDVLTVLCISIVLFVHQNTFGLWSLDSFIKQNFSIFILFAIGGFIFLSGYKLSLNKVNLSSTSFFIDRLFRIAPLYWIALMFYHFFILPDHNTGALILHFFGLQIFFDNIYGPPFITLYYIGIILLYYIIFAFTKKYLHTLRTYLIIQASILILAYAVHIVAPFGINFFEYRFFLYYVFFNGGILTNVYKKRVMQIKFFRSPLCVLPLAIIIIVSLFYSWSWPNDVFSLSYFFIAPSIIFFFIYVLSLSPKYPIHPFVSLLRYSTFAVYLFHRPIWFLFSYICNPIYLPNPQLQWFLINGLGIPIIFFISYWIQVSYDTIILNKKKY